MVFFSSIVAAVKLSMGPSVYDVRVCNEECNDYLILHMASESEGVGKLILVATLAN